MQITQKQIDATHVSLNITAEAELLQTTKATVLKKLGQNVKLQGFRPGKAPTSVVEKNVDQQLLQSDFLDAAVNALYVAAIEDQKLRPVSQPQVSIVKFVPFTTLEIDVTVEVVGLIKLPDYKKLRLAQKPVKIEAKDVDQVIDNLLSRSATKTDVDRAAKDGDEVTIDFSGVDAKTKQPIDGADGKDHPLVIGSNAFIPGFEPELIGLKVGAEKTFDIVFPKDYGAAILQNKKVTFTVTAKKVQALAKPTLDDAFAKTVGPFQSLAELKADVKKQLQAEQETQARRNYESEILETLANQTNADIPQSLVDEEIERQEADERQNLTYRGQTWDEHLKAEGVSAEEHKEKQRPAAELRVKAGLVLSEVAEAEGIRITPEELEVRIKLLKGQYQDAAMQAELDKPPARRDIASRLLSEKTIAKLADYASAK